MGGEGAGVYYNHAAVGIIRFLFTHKVAILWLWVISDDCTRNKSTGRRDTVDTTFLEMRS